MMCPWSSTISEKVIWVSPVVYRAMDAVIVDVGGVLLVPHFEEVRPAFEPFGIRLDAALAERAHYFGIRAMDAASDDEHEARQAYLVGYASGAGVLDGQREQALERMRTVWSGPSIDLWRQQVRGSVDGLRRLKDSGLKL